MINRFLLLFRLLHPFLLGRVSVLGSLPCWKADRVRSQINSTWQNCEQSSGVLKLLQLYQGDNKIENSYVSMNSSVVFVLYFCVQFWCTGFKQKQASWLHCIAWSWQNNSERRRLGLTEAVCFILGLQVSRPRVSWLSWLLGVSSPCSWCWSRGWLHCVGRGCALSRGSAARFLTPAVLAVGNSLSHSPVELQVTLTDNPQHSLSQLSSPWGCRELQEVFEAGEMSCYWAPQSCSLPALPRLIREENREK